MSPYMIYCIIPKIYLMSYHIMHKKKMKQKLKKVIHLSMVRRLKTLPTTGNAYFLLVHG